MTCFFSRVHVFECIKVASFLSGTVSSLASLASPFHNLCVHNPCHQQHQLQYGHLQGPNLKGKSLGQSPPSLQDKWHVSWLEHRYLNAKCNIKNKYQKKTIYIYSCVYLYIHTYKMKSFFLSGAISSLAHLRTCGGTTFAMRSTRINWRMVTCKDKTRREIPGPEPTLTPKTNVMSLL